MSKVIPIEPFNDLFYKTCAYNPILSAVYYYGGNVFPFLSNDVFFYEYNFSATLKINQRFFPVIDEVELCANVGILLEPLSPCGEMFQTVRCAIDTRRPVFVPVDRYLWESSTSNKDSFYLSRHDIHYFLIVGYSIVSSTYTIIDTAPHCYITEIGINELHRCYHSAVQRFKPDFVMSQVYPVKDMEAITEACDRDKNLHILKTNMKRFETEVLTGLQMLLRFANLLEEMWNDSRLEQVSTDDITKIFFFIENAKKAELYRVNRFFSWHDGMHNQLKRIIDDLMIIKATLMKLVISHSSGERIVATLTTRLRGLYALEMEYVDVLLQSLYRRG